MNNDIERFNFWNIELNQVPIVLGKKGKPSEFKNFPPTSWKCINCSSSTAKRSSWDPNLCDFCWHCQMAATF